MNIIKPLLAILAITQNRCRSRFVLSRETTQTILDLGRWKCSVVCISILYNHVIYLGLCCTPARIFGWEIVRETRASSLPSVLLSKSV